MYQHLEATAALPDLYRDARRVLGEHKPLTDEINTLLIRHGPRSGPAP